MPEWQDVTGWNDLVARCLAAQAQRRSEVRAAEVSVARVLEDQARKYPRKSREHVAPGSFEEETPGEGPRTKRESAPKKLRGRGERRPKAGGQAYADGLPDADSPKTHAANW